MDSQVVLFMAEDILFVSIWLLLVLGVCSWMWYAEGGRRKLALFLSVTCTVLLVIVVLLFAGVDSYNETVYNRPMAGQKRMK